MSSGASARRAHRWFHSAAVIRSALAAAALTAQAALGGRFTLGIGPSHQMVAEGLFGESYDRPCTRTAEFVEALESLFETGSATVKGEEIFASGWLTIDAPAVPIMLAALGPRMLGLAGERTAGTSLGSCGPKTIKQHIVPILNDAADRAGRPKPRVMALVGIGITDQPNQRREQSRGHAARSTTNCRATGPHSIERASEVELTCCCSDHPTRSMTGSNSTWKLA